MKMSDKKHHETTLKVEFLRKICDEKEILFGAFSSKLTKQNKTEKWQELHKIALSYKLIQENKTWQYVRDTLWPNFRKRTLTKLDNSRTTGTGGGGEAKMDELDKMVLRILGKDSPTVKGIGVLDSLGLGSSECESRTYSEEIAEDINLPNELLDYPTSPRPEPVPALQEIVEKEPPQKHTGKRKVVVIDSNAHVNRETEEQLKKRKLELQVQHIELLNYKLKLEILQLEQNLNLQRSSHTEDLKPQDNMF